MDITRLVESLTPLEKKVIPFLDEKSSLSSLEKKTGLQEVEILRALNWLKSRKIIDLKDEIREVITTDKNGLLYLKKGLPEKRFLESVKGGKKDFLSIKNDAGLDDDEIKISIGVLKRKNAISTENNIVHVTSQGLLLLKRGFKEEEFLKKLPLQIHQLSEEESVFFEDLKKRKEIIKVNIEKNYHIVLKELCVELKKITLNTVDFIEGITTDIITSRIWETKKFRRYDIQSQAPRFYPGKKQQYRKFLDDVRKKFVALGFQEMNGPIIETEFWNMDALFMPQFHSARDIHDAYYIKGPLYGQLDEQLVKKVAKAHEKGEDTSKGWNYTFDVKKTHKLLLRTQGTACSARILASKDLHIPGKYFALARCFRYDVVDVMHNSDFFQTEGIVVEEHLNMRHLIGLLKMFAKEFAETEKIKIVPSYFPFTEPSVELFARHPQLGWIELGGAGIFRPEVVIPLLGKKISVLAWGIGIDRIAMFKLGIKDIRDLFSKNLQYLRSTKA